MFARKNGDLLHLAINVDHVTVWPTTANENAEGPSSTRSEWRKRHNRSHGVRPSKNRILMKSYSILSNTNNVLSKSPVSLTSMPWFIR